MNAVYAVCVTVLALGVLGFLAWRQNQQFARMRYIGFQQRAQVTPIPEPTGLSLLVREQIVVTMKTGETFSGVLWEETGRELILRGAAGVSMDRGNDIGIDGELLVFVSDIAYVQKP